MRATHPFHIADLATFLEGRWHLVRWVQPAGDAPAGHFHGGATFSAREPTVLDYFEQGELTIGGRVLEARRQLVYRLLTPSSAEVRFANGAYFHALNLSSGSARASHRCASDFYFGRFLVVSKDVLVVCWRVIGREKSFASTARCTRLEDGSGAALAFRSPAARSKETA